MVALNPALRKLRQEDSDWPHSKSQASLGWATESEILFQK